MGKRINSKNIRFDDRVAIVTGAGGGLGRGYALDLAKRGAKVVVNDFGGSVNGSGRGSTSLADGVVEEINALGGEAVASYDSVATVEGGQAIVKRAIETFGRVDILINNAGIVQFKNFAGIEPEEWNRMLSVHLTGAYNVTHPAFLKMRERNYGRIVMTTSDVGLFGNNGQLHYGAAKMGLVGFMNTLKLEGKEYNIKVNAIAPMANTRMSMPYLRYLGLTSEPEMLKKGKPELIAPIVLCLCSEECPVTGYIYHAGLGFYRRVAVVGGPGIFIGDGEEIPTPEEIYQHWDSINNLSGAKEFYDRVQAQPPKRK